MAMMRLLAWVFSFVFRGVGMIFLIILLIALPGLLLGGNSESTKYDRGGIKIQSGHASVNLKKYTNWYDKTEAEKIKLANKKVDKVKAKYDKLDAKYDYYSPLRLVCGYYDDGNGREQVFEYNYNSGLNVDEVQIAAKNAEIRQESQEWYEEYLAKEEAEAKAKAERDAQFNARLQEQKKEREKAERNGTRNKTEQDYLDELEELYEYYYGY